MLPFKDPEFIEVKGIRYPEIGFYDTESGWFSGLVVHYTVSGRNERSARGVVSHLSRLGLGAMVMDENGLIYVGEGFDPLCHWGHHAGVSKWRGMVGLSKYFAGMEICSWGRGSKHGPLRHFDEPLGNIYPGTYQAFTEAQESSLINFCLWALDINPEFNLANVCGHDEVRAEAGKPGDKTDPGGSLSMTMPAFRQHLGSLISSN